LVFSGLALSLFFDFFGAEPLGPSFFEPFDFLDDPLDLEAFDLGPLDFDDSDLSFDGAGAFDALPALLSPEDALPESLLFWPRSPRFRSFLCCCPRFGPPR
jgi:hypothetical protein